MVIQIIEKITFMITATAVSAFCFLMYTGHMKIVSFGENMWVVSIRPFH